MMVNEKIKMLMNRLKPTIDAVSLNSCPSHCGLQDDLKICGQHEDDCSICWRNAVKAVITEVAKEDKILCDSKPAIKVIIESGCPSDCGLEDKDELCGVSKESCVECWNEALNAHVDKKEDK